MKYVCIFLLACVSVCYCRPQTDNDRKKRDLIDDTILEATQGGTNSQPGNLGRMEVNVMRLLEDYLAKDHMRKLALEQLLSLAREQSGFEGRHELRKKAAFWRPMGGLPAASRPGSHHDEGASSDDSDDGVSLFRYGK